jgi:hypothetical protein
MDGFYPTNLPRCLATRPVGTRKFEKFGPRGRVLEFCACTTLVQGIARAGLWLIFTGYRGA